MPSATRLAGPVRYIPSSKRRSSGPAGVITLTGDSAIPLATAKVMGYADALRATGTTEGLEWTPAVKVATPAPASPAAMGLANTDFVTPPR